MSVATAVARVAEIEALLAGAQGAPAAPAAPGGFNQQLVQAANAGGGVAAGGPGAAGAAVPASGGTDAGPGPFKAEIEDDDQKHGLDPALLRALIRAESNFNPRATSPAGARGLTQLMPGTAASLGVRDPYDPAQAIDGGARYLRQQLDAFGGDVRKALAAYNAGPGAVQRYGGVPPYAETQNYVRRVLGYAEQYRGGASSTPTTV